MPQDKMRRTLLDRVQMYEFAVIEANLYLDTHPQDQDALKYHDKYANLLEQAKAEYEKQFGALNPMKANNGASCWQRSSATCARPSTKSSRILF